MILEGREFINEELKLSPGDRFRVYIDMVLDEYDCFDYYLSTPNSNDDMARLNGQWVIVTGVTDELQEYTHEDEQEYKGYIHTIEDRQWEWWWMHMDAVELNTRTNVPIRTDKFMALPEVM